MKKALLVFVVFATLIGCACDRGYSDGDRTGVIYKFSHKGIWFKSWEGEMLLGGARQTDQGTVANVWEFTVLDNALVSSVRAAQESGKPVQIHYIQWLNASPFEADTDYEVLSIKKTEEP